MRAELDSMKRYDNHSAPGWEAIESILVSIYPGITPKCYDADHSFKNLPDVPLDRICCYPAERNETLWWHYVTFGFTELYNKVYPSREISGFGFELTCRLPRAEGEKHPPGWALNFLQNLASHAFACGSFFMDGDHMDLNGPIVQDASTELIGLAFTRDDILPSGRSRNGAFYFLQVIGLTSDELNVLVRWSSKGFLKQMRKLDPLLLLDLDRPCMMQQESFRTAVERGAAKDGSDTEMSFTYDLNWKTHTRDNPKLDLYIGAHALRAFLQVFPGRLPFGRDFTAHGDEKTILFWPSEDTSWDWDGDIMVIRLSQEDSQHIMNSVHPREGVYPVGSSGIRFHVSKTEICDENGAVIAVVG
jgi:hypothetical protein